MSVISCGFLRKAPQAGPLWLPAPACRLFPGRTFLPGPATVPPWCLPGETPVSLPCGSLPMGASPLRHRGGAGVTPAQWSVLAGGHRRMHFRLASAWGNHPCPGDRHRADFRWGGWPAWKQVSALVEGSSKGLLYIRGCGQPGGLAGRRHRARAVLGGDTEMRPGLRQVEKSVGATS